MRLILAILFCTAGLFGSPAHAQYSGARVVQSCATTAPWPPLNATTIATAGTGWIAVDTNMRLCLNGAAVSVCPQATAYLARTTGGNEGGNAVNITALICGLVTDGLIDGDLLTGKCGSHLDALYVLAQQNATDAVLNLCGTSYTLTNVFGATFTSYVGYAFPGSSQLDTNFNPTTASSPRFVQNSGNFGFWSYSVVVEGSPEMGNSTAGTASNVYSSFTGSIFYTAVNGGTLAATPTPGTNGLFVGDRSSSSNTVSYWNGISKISEAGASSAVLNADFTVGLVSGGSSTAQKISEAHIGGSLSPTLNLALYTRLRTYLTAVGVP